MNWPLRWRKLPVFGAVGVVLIGAVAVTAIASSAAPKRNAPPAAGATARSPQVPVIVPGRPGESSKVLPPDQVTVPDGRDYGPLDVVFVRMMIPHHIQAVEMAALAPARSGNPQILAVAGRIKAAQVPEIAQLRSWLSARGLTEDGPAGHDHGTMRGMQTPDAMRALAAANGDAFDRLFVTMMSEHHRGAIEMATEILRVTTDLSVEEMATAIASEQSIEISRMRELLGG
jgi:uncharacterized protein (DUF305 family)